jgi:NAD(P)-dependent dehydrogenase (short-subunit alcohol dehydrogenase family)
VADSPLDGKAAIVTGAGRGLGRVEALQLAKLGARVVVNDLGVAADGSGSDERPAQTVVNEITAAGGEAVANYGDVADWEDSRRMVEQAVQTFGDLHILVNNAGFLRDRMIFNMEEEDWDSVIRVHLKGHFCMSRWATAHWRDRSKAADGPVYARIINTASEAFLYGSPGQPNYAAAKAGIAALTLATAQSCARYGVTANAICPRARTRMTEGTLGGMFDKPAEGFDAFDPQNVAPLVGFLASPAAGNVSGQVFIVHGGMVQALSAPGVSQRFDSANGAWTFDALSTTLSQFFQKRQPIKDGFVMPYG